MDKVGYIEIIFVLNYLINILVIYSSAIILNRILSIKKVLLSGIVGLIPTVIYLFCDYLIINLLLVVITSLLMSIISFGYKNIIYTLKNTFYMYMSSIFLGGLLYLVDVNFNNFYFNILVISLIAPLILLLYVKSTIKIQSTYSNYYTVSIYFKEEVVTCLAFLDTGNKLISPYDGSPIILLDKGLVKNHYQKLLVPCHSINGNTMLECVKPIYINIDKVGKRTKLLVGLIDEVKIDGVDCILNSRLLERI